MVLFLNLNNGFRYQFDIYSFNQIRDLNCPD